MIELRSYTHVKLVAIVRETACAIPHNDVTQLPNVVGIRLLGIAPFKRLFNAVGGETLRAFIISGRELRAMRTRARARTHTRVRIC